MLKTTYHQQLNISFLLYEIFNLATRWERPVPVLWHQLIPMVKIMNNGIILDSFIHNTVYRTKKCYYMLTYVYGIYYHYFNI